MQTAFNGTGSFGTCTLCQRRPALDAGGFCRACAHVQSYNVPLETTRQVAHAVRALNSTAELVRWPWASMDRIGGPFPLGSVNFVAAASGIGKTTWVLDFVRRMVEGGTGCTIIPTETSAPDFRIALGASVIGENHSDVWEWVARISEGDTVAESHRDRLAIALKLMAPQHKDDDQTWLQLCHVTDDEVVTLSALDKAFAVAKAMGHKIVIIDHGDLVEAEAHPLTGRMPSGLDAVREVNNAIMQLAKYHRLAAIVMCQANGSYLGDGSNPLMRYRPLSLKHLMYNSFKIPNATQIWGLYRPLSVSLDSHDAGLARASIIEARTLLKPHRMGVQSLKLRHRGQNEGESTEFVYANGRVRDLSNDEQAKETLMKQMAHDDREAERALKQAAKQKRYDKLRDDTPKRFGSD